MAVTRGLHPKPPPFFMGLPTELRELIYIHLFMDEDHGYINLCSLITRPITRKFPILHLNSQVRSEALGRLYTKCTFYIRGYDQLEHSLESPGVDLAKIRKMAISVWHSSEMDFMDAFTSPCPFPALRELEVTYFAFEHVYDGAQNYEYTNYIALFDFLNSVTTSNSYTNGPLRLSLKIPAYVIEFEEKTKSDMALIRNCTALKELTIGSTRSEIANVVTDDDLWRCRYNHRFNHSQYFNFAYELVRIAREHQSLEKFSLYLWRYDDDDD